MGKNDAADDVPPGLLHESVRIDCLHHLFERQVHQTPQRIAVIAGDKSLTYLNLNHQAEKIASWLRMKGTGPETIVAVCMDRSLELVVALLAILKAGGAFLPIDPLLPDRRKVELVSDGEIQLVLVGNVDLDRFGKSNSIVTTIPDPSGLPECEDIEHSQIDGSSLAYVIYTSGSTGRPKGVMIEHRSIVNLMTWSQNAYPMGESDRLLQRTSIGFDASIWELFAAFTGGSTLVMAPSEDSRNLASLVSTIRKYEVTQLQLVPSLFSLLIDEPGFRECNSLERVFCGGEQLTGLLVERFRKLRLRASLNNFYGPSEAAVDVTSYTVEDQSIPARIPIGKAIAGTRLVVVGKDMMPVQSGESGELLIGGVCLARGYLNRPELTSDAFVPDPTGRFAGEQFYRTGDLVRELPDGNFEYIDRLDSQVKISGVRVEPSETEAVLSKHPQVREAAVVVSTRPTGDKVLIAYAVAEKPAELTDRIVKEYLVEQLPVSQLPAHALIQSSNLPRLPSGKIDRDELVREAGTLLQTTGEQSANPPVTDTEVKLAALWEKVLGIQVINRGDDFLDVGGDSLAAMRLLNLIRLEFERNLNFADLFSDFSLAGLAKLLDSIPKLDVALANAPLMTKRKENENCPLTPSQEEIFIECLRNPDSPVYNEVCSIHFKQSVDATLLEKALNSVVERQSVLRTAFVFENGIPLQTVKSAAKFPLEVKPYDGDEYSQLVSQAESDASIMAREPFNLQNPPLVRGLLARFLNGGDRLYLTMHHLISDGYSCMNIFVDDLWACYSNSGSLKELTYSYTDYARWKQQSARQAQRSKAPEYWKNKLNGMVPFRLEGDRSSQVEPHRSGGLIRFKIGRELSTVIKSSSARYRTTPFVLLLAAFKLMLHRLSQKADISLGSAYSDRSLDEFEGIAGCFLDFMVLRSRINPTMTFEALIEDVQTTLHQAIEHKELPLYELASLLNEAEDGARNSLYNIMFLLEPASTRSPADWEVCQFEFHTNTSKLDMTFGLDEGKEGYFGRVEYNTGLFSPLAVQRFIARYRKVLQGVCERPEMSLSEFDIMPKEESNLVSKAFNKTQHETDTSLRLYDSLELYAHSHPKSIAVIAEDRNLSYAELKLYSDAVAGFIQAQGVLPDERVAVIARRSSWLSVALFGVLKSGAAYVPIDPDQPEERMRYILNDCGAKLILRDNNVILRDGFAVSDYIIKEIANQEEQIPWSDVARPENLAYCIYTSGSTGNPKGTLIEHRSIMNRLLWMIDEYALDDSDIVIQKTPITFDVSLPELFVWSMVGATVVMPPPGAERDPSLLIDLVKRHGVTQIHFVPSMLDVFLSYLKAFQQTEDLRTIRNVFCSGEAISPVVVSTFQKILGKSIGARLHNLYGPTEAAVEVSYYECTNHGSDQPVPIGKPVWNTRLFILDRKGKPMPIGVTGELYIEGIQVSRGYLNRPELNAKVFTTISLDDELVQIYRTGDQARWLPDGNVEYLGRNDHQVKIRGIRVELGEIESALREVDWVSGALVTASTEDPVNPRLYAYVTRQSSCDSTFGPDEILHELSQSLPSHLIPDRIFELESFPLTSSGKVDRSRLVIPEDSSTEAAVLTDDFSLDPLGLELARIWKSVTGWQGPVDGGGFFEQGGHSLLAVKLVAKIQEELNLSINLPDFFNKPDFTSLLEASKRAQRSGNSKGRIEPRSEGDLLPLSWGQRRLWFLHQLDEEGTAHNIVLPLEIKGNLNITALSRSLCKLIIRHEALRTIFEDGEPEPMQRVLPPEKATGKLLKIVECSLEDGDKSIAEFIQKGYRKSFDLKSEPPFEVWLNSFTGQSHLLTLVIHHIICDEIAAGVILEELIVGYNSAKLESYDSIQTPTLQAGDIAVWERSEKQIQSARRQLDYWEKSMHDAPRILPLPLDYARPANPFFKGARVERILGKNISTGIRELFREADCTPFMGFMALWAILLSRICGERELIIGAPVSLRKHQGLERTVGFLVNTLPFRLRLEDNTTLSEMLAQVRERVIEGYQRADLPFEQLVEFLNPRRLPGVSPIFQVMLVIEGAELDLPEMDGCECIQRIGTSNASKFDLTLFVAEVDGAYELKVEYRSDLFAEETVQGWLAALSQLSESAVHSKHSLVENLGIVSPVERQKQFRWAASDKAINCKWLSIHELVLEKADLAPEYPAVIAKQEALSYAELNRDSRYLAIQMQARISGKRGISPRIGIFINRSTRWLVALLATLRSGAVYVPLDPDWPDERIQWILKDSAISMVLVESDAVAQSLKAAIEGDDDLKDLIVMTISLQMEKVSEEQDEVVFPEVKPQDPAYIIYTSGSTGRPKGVLVEHGNVLASTLARKLSYNEDPERFLLLSPTVFDSSIAGIFWTLGTGGTLVLPPEDSIGDPETLANYICEMGITHYLTLPSFHSMLLQRLEGRKTALRSVIVAGETCPVALPQAHRNVLPGVQLYNEYGPTEGTVWCTVDEITDVQPESQRVPIGKPIPGSRIYLVDKNMGILPRGSIGEIVIAGDGLARGYLNQAHPVEDRFLEGIPSLQEERVYRTGDLGRWNIDGKLEFIGRIDNQVKIRGYRIEPGEIEAALMSIPDVVEAVVLTREFGEDDIRLVAHVLPANDTPLDPKDLRAKLSRLLPSYMLPSIIQVQDTLPRNVSGKVDRKALASLELEFSNEASRSSNDYVTTILISIWESLLGREGIRSNDDFFEAGGDSFMAVRLFSKISERFSLSLSIANLYHASTVAELAKLVRKGLESSNRTEDPLVIPISPGSLGAAPVFFVHPRDGGILVYRKLAAALGDERPLYGIEAPWLRGKTEVGETVEEIAANYISSVQKNLKGNGPVHLCGFSTGGLIALELAQQLKAAGHSIGVVCLLDTYNPANPPKRRDRIRRWIKRFQGEDVNSGYNNPKAIIKLLWNTVLVKVGVLIEATGGIKARYLRKTNKEVPITLLHFESRRNMTKANNHYRPKPFSGRVVLFRTEFEGVDYIRQDDLGWAAAGHKEFAVEHIPGHHMTFLDEDDHLPALASKMSDMFQEYEANCRQR